MLFLATGAAYNKEQLAQQRESYLPAFTDKEGAVKEKRNRLMGLIEAARNRAGNAWTTEMEQSMQTLFNTNASSPAKPSAQQVERKVIGGKSYIKQNGRWYSE